MPGRSSIDKDELVLSSPSRSGRLLLLLVLKLAIAIVVIAKGVAIGGGTNAENPEDRPRHSGRVTPSSMCNAAGAGTAAAGVRCGAVHLLVVHHPHHPVILQRCLTAVLPESTRKGIHQPSRRVVCSVVAATGTRSTVGTIPSI